jgi:hypothetical protein
MEQHAFKIRNKCWNINISIDLETSGGQGFILNAVFLTQYYFRHLLQLNAFVFLHRYLMDAVPLEF